MHMHNACYKLKVEQHECFALTQQKIVSKHNVQIDFTRHYRGFD
jgi:hypothetical protein